MIVSEPCTFCNAHAISALAPACVSLSYNSLDGYPRPELPVGLPSLPCSILPLTLPSSSSTPKSLTLIVAPSSSLLLFLPNVLGDKLSIDDPGVIAYDPFDRVLLTLFDAGLPGP